MNAPQNHAKTIFLDAVDIAVPAERQAYVAAQCGGDLALRRDVEGLLQHYEAQGHFLEAGPCGPGAAEPAVTERPGTVIGPYKLLQQIGEGGMGAVFMAEQTQPVRRKVALKVIKAGMDSRQVIARFEAERQALAMMDHQNIARVLDVGATDTGRPFFVMELVHGIPITKYCDDNHLPPRERLELFVPVCQALQHAHQKGVIHRDVKPSNVMVTLYDGQPVPKVIDFGVAKATEQSLTERTMFTQFGQMVGTLEYMSPEQAEMSGLGVDTRSDIYSLGVLLYELLTGSTPLSHKRLKEAAYAEALRMIKEEEPLKPSTRLSTSKELPSIALNRGLEPTKLRGLVRGELDWIVMKALEKDRRRRYETANGLARDIQRYLNDEAVEACPPSAVYQLRKFVRRHKKAFATVSAAVLLVLLSVVGLAVSNVLITEQKNQKDVALREKDSALKDKEAALTVAQQSEREAKDQLFLALVNQARAGRFSRQMGQRLESLAALEKAARIRPDERLRDEAIAAMALPDVRRGRSLHAFPAGTKAVAYDALYQSYARIDDRGIISIRSIPDNEEIRPPIETKTKSISTMSLSPSGQFVAVIDSQNALQLWRVADGEPLLQDQPQPCWCVAFSPDSRQVAVAKDDGILTIDLTSGQETKRWRLPAKAYMLAYHPKNRSLAVGYSASNVASIYDSTQGSHVADLAVGPLSNQVVAWHPDGARLAVAGFDPRIQIWDVAARRKLATLEGHVEPGLGLSFHPDSELLASASWEGVLRLWDPGTGRQLMQLPLAATAQFSSTGQWLGHVWQGGEHIQLLEVTPSREYRTLVSSLGAGQGLHEGAISPDGRLLALGMGHAGDRLWDLSSGRELTVLSPGGTCVLLHSPFTPTSPPGERGKREAELLTCGGAGLQRWPIQYSKETDHEIRLGPPQAISLPFLPLRASRSADGQTLALVSETAGAGLILDLTTASLQGRHFAHPKASFVAISGDGRWAASSGWHSDRVRLWNAKTGKMVHEWVLGAQARVFFTPDSRALIICRGDAFTFWNVETLQPIRRLDVDVALYPGYVAFSPDGTLMAMEMAPAVIHLKEVATGRTIAKLEDPHGDRAGWMGFTPDGTQLVVAAPYAKAIHVWDLRAIRVRLKAMGLDWKWDEFKPAPEAAPGRSRGSARLAGGSARLAISVDHGPLTQSAFVDPRRAVAVFSLAIALNPLDYEAYHQRGMAYGRLYDRRKAIDDYSTFLILTPPGSPGRVDALLRRANNYYGLNDSAGALADLKELLALDPREVGSLEHRLALFCNNVAWRHVAAPQKELPSLVLALAQKATELGSNNVHYRNTLGVVFYRLSRYQEAVDCFEHNLEANQDYPAFDLYFLAMSRQRLGQPAEAKGCFDRANAWRQTQTDLSAAYTAELTAVRAEAAKLLAMKSGQ
jgi:serine/threonine protein kinase/WD40 repeat protein